jgi:hypothetical protein
MSVTASTVKVPHWDEAVVLGVDGVAVSRRAALR